MPWVIAIMVALTVMAAAAGLALRNVAQVATAELSGGVTVQILEARPEARDRQAQAVQALLRSVPGVASVRAMPQGEVDRLIAPWLGGAADASEAVPVPALIDARMNGPVTPARLAELSAMVRRVAPAARIDGQAGWLRPVFGAIDSLQWLAVALVLVLAGAMAAAVLLAARGALTSHRPTIEIVHMLGGTDSQIARIFQRSIGIDAAAGGIAGLLAALALVGFVGRRFGDLGAGLVEGGALGWTDWLMLAAIPAVGVALAMLTARLSVLGALRRIL